MIVYTVSFFGHRIIENPFHAEHQVEMLVRSLLSAKEYVEFLIGRDGEFDQLVSSAVHRAWRQFGQANSELNWVMAYPKAEYENDMKSFDEYYSYVELCLESAKAHPKQAIQIRNRSMVDRSDLIVFYIEHESGGAFRTMQYAKSIGKKTINLAGADDIL